MKNMIGKRYFRYRVAEISCIYDWFDCLIIFIDATGRPDAQSDILHNSCTSVCIWCCVHAWLRFDDWRTNEDDRNAKWVL